MGGNKYFPRRLSFPKICDILVAYLNAGADKGYVGVSDVVERSNVSLHNISRNNNFFKSTSTSLFRDCFFILCSLQSFKNSLYVFLKLLRRDI